MDKKTFLKEKPICVINFLHFITELRNIIFMLVVLSSRNLVSASALVALVALVLILAPE